MAKKQQSFSDKVNRGQGPAAKQMAKLVLSEKNHKGHFSFRTKMVDSRRVKEELAAARR